MLRNSECTFATYEQREGNVSADCPVNDPSSSELVHILLRPANYNSVPTLIQAERNSILNCWYKAGNGYLKELSEISESGLFKGYMMQTQGSPRSLILPGSLISIFITGSFPKTSDYYD